MCITNSKKSLVVKQKEHSRITIDNDHSGIWDLHLVAWCPAGKKKNLRSQRMMSDHMVTWSDQMTRENIIQPQLCGSYVTSRRPTSISTTCYYSFVRLITAVINYKITLTAHFSLNSDLFIKPLWHHITYPRLIKSTHKNTVKCTSKIINY